MSALRVLPSPSKVRPSRASRWRAGALVAVHLLIAAHLAHWWLAGRTVTPVEPSEAMAFAKAGVINAGLIFFAATILLTAVFGRFFCGWACHLVALQDLCRWLLAKVGIRPQPLRSRVLLWVPAIAFVYMFLWPVAYRLWIRGSFAHRELELTTAEFWATFPGPIVGSLTLIVCGFVVVYFLGAKGFCTYACPYGAVFGLAERVAPLRIRVTDACEGCGHCTAVCSSNVRVHEEVRDFGMVVDAGCMKCLDCVSVCPNDALYYGAGPIPWLARPRVEAPLRRPSRLGWGEEALLAGAFAAAFFTFRGLYGAVPFLFALGIAAVLAYLAWLAARLVRRPDFAFRGWRLKQAGRLLPAGRRLAVMLAVVGAFWLHSGVVRVRAAVAPLPDRVERYVDASRAQAEAGDLPAAAATLAAGLERFPEAVALHYSAGVVAAMRGDPSGAADFFAAVLAREPGHREARENLAGMLAAGGRFDEAAEQYRQALAMAPDDVDTRFLLARALLGGGRTEEAAAELRECLRRDPRHAPAAGLLAEVEAASTADSRRRP